MFLTNDKNYEADAAEDHGNPGTSLEIPSPIKLVFYALVFILMRNHLANVKINVRLLAIGYACHKYISFFARCTIRLMFETAC